MTLCFSTSHIISYFPCLHYVFLFFSGSIDTSRLHQWLSLEFASMKEINKPIEANKTIFVVCRVLTFFNVLPLISIDVKPRIIHFIIINLNSIWRFIKMTRVTKNHIRRYIVYIIRHALAFVRDVLSFSILV